MSEKDKMSNASSGALAVGAGVSTTNLRRVPRNKEGLSYHEWLKYAGKSNTKKCYDAWRLGKSPLDFASETSGGALDNPTMSTSAKVAIGVGIGVAAIGATVGLVYLVKKAQAKANASKSWKRATVVQPGMKVRIAVDVATWAMLANAPFGVSDDARGLAGVLAGPDFNGSAVTVFAPGAPLTGDWVGMPGDPGPLVWHAEFVYNGQQPLDANRYHAPTLLNFMWAFA